MTLPILGAGPSAVAVGPITLLTNLVSWWSLNETSGTRNDSHGTNHLTDNNTVGFAAGKQGNAADFEKNNSEYLNRTFNSSFSTGDIDFSIAFWYKPESTGSTYDLISRWGYLTNAKEYLIRLNSSSNFHFFISDDGTTDTANIANTLVTVSAGNWYFVICHHDSVNNEIGIQVNNGTIQTLAHSTGVFSGNSDFWMGALNGAVNLSDGLFDEVVFAKRIWTADERTELYAAGAGMTYPG